MPSANLDNRYFYDVTDAKKIWERTVDSCNWCPSVDSKLG